MGSNLSRQSERKDERREDFAVYDAQNYRKICERYMLVVFIFSNFALFERRFRLFSFGELITDQWSVTT